MMEKLEMLLIGLLLIGYISINFVSDLPKFLIGENIMYAALYSIALVALYKKYDWAQIYTILLAGFNAGRVSRSIISPRGEFGELAKEHVPLFLLILMVALISLYIEIKNK